LKPRRVNVLMNESSGHVEGDRSDTIRRDLESTFKQHAIEADVEFLSGPELEPGAKRALQSATAGRVDAVIVGGGDGSIRTVAGVLAGSGVPLGIIPWGTLNHFAKDLKIPLSLAAAAAVIAAGEVREVDVGEVNGRIFINNSSIGVYPYLVIDRERRRRQTGSPKWLAMAAAVLRAFRYFPLRRLTIRGSGHTDSARSPCVFVGNNEYRFTGPFAGSRAKLDGGTLCVYVAKQQTMGALFWLACRSLLGLLDQRRDLRVVTLSAVDISAHSRKLLVALDGEVESIRAPLHYRTRPKSLCVFAPSTNGHA